MYHCLDQENSPLLLEITFLPHPDEIAFAHQEVRVYFLLANFWVAQDQLVCDDHWHQNVGCGVVCEERERGFRAGRGDDEFVEEGCEGTD